MIRQRVDRHGHIFHLEPASELPGCNVPTDDIGVIKEGPVRKWMAAKRQWDTKYASAKRSVQKKRAKEMAQGYQEFGNGEVPPPSALAGRRKTGEDLKEEKRGKSMGMGLWALWGSKHDEKALKNEQDAQNSPETTVASSLDGAGARPLHDTQTNKSQTLGAGGRPEASRSRSRRRTVVDEHQTDGADNVDENTPAAALLAIKNANTGSAGDDHLAPDFAGNSTNPAILVRTPTNEDKEYDLKRPKAGGIAFPFSVKGHQTTASMTTLTSAVGVPPSEDVRTEGALNSGVQHNATDVGAITSNAIPGANSSGGIASVIGRPATASTTTLTSAVGVPPTEDVRTEGALNSGVQPNTADIEAAATTIKGVPEVNGGSVKGKEPAIEPPVLHESTNGSVVTPSNTGGKVVENGEVISAERPPLETFVTAPMGLPTITKEA